MTPAAGGHQPFRDDPEYTRQRRQVIRQHHPDRGGSDAALIQALAELDERWARRSQFRAFSNDVRPPFISQDVADAAVDTADLIVTRFHQAASSVANSTERVRGVRLTAREAARARARAQRKARRDEQTLAGAAQAVAKGLGGTAATVAKRAGAAAGSAAHVATSATTAALKRAAARRSSSQDPR